MSVTLRQPHEIVQINQTKPDRRWTGCRSISLAVHSTPPQKLQPRGVRFGVRAPFPQGVTLRERAMLITKLGCDGIELGPAGPRSFPHPTFPLISTGRAPHRVVNEQNPLTSGPVTCHKCRNGLSISPPREASRSSDRLTRSFEPRPTARDNASAIPPNKIVKAIYTMRPPSDK